MIPEPDSADQTRIDLSFDPGEDSPGDLSVDSDGTGRTGGALSPADRNVEIPDRVGDYEIEQWLGSGGMGRVYLARHIHMHRKVAVKFLPPAGSGSVSSIDRFFDEVRTASQLLHPNIVTAFDAGVYQDLHYLAMEYVDGVTLTQWVQQNGVLPVGEAAAVIRQAALGLLHAHRAGIVHRDVKPGNLMRAADGTVKVLDLGLARTRQRPGVRDRDQSGARLVGTLAFISPEQLENPGDVDPRSDIYSLGATLFFLLAGRPPFTGPTIDQVYGHRHGDIPDLMQVRDDVDLGLANIFNRMMAKTPQERYASMDEVIDDLSDYATSTAKAFWNFDFDRRAISPSHSTEIPHSTAETTMSVLGIDFGMSYAAAAEAMPTGGVRVLAAGGGKQTNFRLAIAQDGESRLYGKEATDRRSTDPRSVLHCVPLYLGQAEVERPIAGRKVPPEVLIAMLLRRLRRNAWDSRPAPLATAITVPSVYDQLRRRGILQAAIIAGLPSVRLVDRCVAAVQSVFLNEGGGDDELQPLDLDDQSQPRRILYVGLTGSATEVALIDRRDGRLHELGIAGHWQVGKLQWQQKLIELAAKTFIRDHRFDPRKELNTAAEFQVACERALSSMTMLPVVTVAVHRGDAPVSVVVHRGDWLRACSKLLAGLQADIDRVLTHAGVPIDSVTDFVSMGNLMRMGAVRIPITRRLPNSARWRPVERCDVASGAAACLASELPGRGDVIAPHRGIASQTIGIVIEDVQGRRRILPIVPKGTKLPARVNRRLGGKQSSDMMKMSLVESSGIDGRRWQSLGRHSIELKPPADQTVAGEVEKSRLVSFEVDVNGLLSMRAQSPGTEASLKLPALPPPNLSEDEIASWVSWLNTS